MRWPSNRVPVAIARQDCQTWPAVSTTNFTHDQQCQQVGVTITDVTRSRPRFHEEIGNFLIALRDERGWSLRQAAAIAKQKGLNALTRQILLRLEHGQVKNPEVDVLRALATLYGVPYQDVAQRFIERIFGLRVSFPKTHMNPPHGVTLALRARHDTEEARLLTGGEDAGAAETTARENEEAANIAELESIDSIVAALESAEDTIRRSRLALVTEHTSDARPDSPQFDRGHPTVRPKTARKIRRHRRG